MTYLITGIIIIIGTFIWITSCKSSNDSKTISDADSSGIKTYKTKDNQFEALRDRAFSITPEQLGISLTEEGTTVYGVIMDWEMGGAVASTISYASGDASLYLSSGGGVIGGGQHENVNAAAKTFVKMAQDYLSKASETKTTALPNINTVNFYFLTNKGIFIGKEEMKNFENSSSDWLNLFEEGNKVLSELRLVSDK